MCFARKKKTMKSLVQTVQTVPSLSLIKLFYLTISTKQKAIRNFSDNFLYYILYILSYGISTGSVPRRSTIVIVAWITYLLEKKRKKTILDLSNCFLTTSTITKHKIFFFAFLTHLPWFVSNSSTDRISIYRL